MASTARQRTLEIVLFPMLGALMVGAQVAMEGLPNIHLTGMFVLLFTAVVRKKALIPVYVYVLIMGVRWGFTLYWMPYLYVWAVLWAMGMLVPERTPKKITVFCYPAIGFLHGISYGTLYAPSQALFFGLDFSQTVAWIAAGFPWDVVHALGNLAFCTLVLPLSLLLRKLLRKAGMR